ncbi:MAG: 16S rRNA (guanine(966)-N(2))-methyltransferase RsmD [Pseudomonadota bacterium]
MRIIAGRFKGRRIATPKGRGTRPTTDRNREALFSALAHQLGQDFSGHTVVDLFAGTGALGFEALSRGAETTTFVENNAKVVDALKASAEQLGVQQASNIVRGDAMKLTRGGPYTLVFSDPPYDKEIAAQSLLKLHEAEITRPNTLYCVDASQREIASFEAPPFVGLWSKHVGASYLAILEIHL